jgi:hypothetical protein
MLAPRRKRKRFFFEKKKQKTFGLRPLRVARAVPHTPAQSKKVFLLLFVHKKKSLLKLTQSP